MMSPDPKSARREGEAGSEAPEPGRPPGKGTPTPAAARPFRERPAGPLLHSSPPPLSAMRRRASALMQRNAMQCKQRHLGASPPLARKKGHTGQSSSSSVTRRFFLGACLIRISNE